VLETGGTAVVKDDNADLKSDGLSGHFTGSFVFGGSGVATFDVPFQATPK
jgi:hypothetical protein